MANRNTRGASNICFHQEDFMATPHTILLVKVALTKHFPYTIDKTLPAASYTP